MPKSYYIAISKANRYWNYYMKTGNKEYKAIAQANYQKAEDIKKAFLESL